MQTYPQTTPSDYDAYPANAGSTTSVTLRHYWHVLLERRWMIVLVLIAAIGSSVAYIAKAQKIYRASTRIQIDPESETRVNLREGGASLARMDQDYLQTQYRNLLSRTLLGQVVKAEGLERDERYSRERDVIAAVAKDIRVSPIRMTRLVELSVEHPNPRKAADIANRLASEFIDQNNLLKIQRTMGALNTLRTQANQMERDVASQEEAVQRYREETAFVSLDTGDNTIAMALGQAQGSYATMKATADISQTTVGELESHLAAGKPPETFPAIATDSRITSQQLQLSGYEVQLAGLLERFKDEHPAVKDVRSKIEAARSDLQKTANTIAQTLREKARLDKALVVVLAERVADWERQQQDWQKAKTGYDVLQRRADASRVLFNMVMAKFKEVEIMQRDTANNIRVVDPASIPVEPVKPIVPLVLLGGIFGGLVLAIGLALFINLLDDSIKTQDDVEMHLRVPFLGYVPSMKTNKVVARYLQSHLHPQSNAAESFRSIRAAISLGDHGERLRVLTVTSTIPSEGKSIAAANLAIVMAQTGLKTLLVDADLRRPTLHKSFQLHSPVGLPDYLLRKTDNLDDLIHPSEVSNLDIICSDATSSQSTELVASKQMAQFIQEVSKRYDRVVLDCPPVSAVSDPLVVSALADGTVFVTKFNKVRREHARKSVQRLLDAGVHLCGVLLNDIDFEGRDTYYYSYYHYQNRYYSSYRRPRTDLVESA